MLFLDLSTLKYSSEKHDRISKCKEKSILNFFENIVRNEAFSHYEHMIFFLQYFQMSFATEVLKGACMM